MTGVQTCALPISLKATGASVNNNVVVFPTYADGVIDTTVATASIDKGGVKAIMYGQGISAEGKWDGTISFSEKYTPVAWTGGVEPVGLSDTVSVNLQTPAGSSIAETFTALEFASDFTFESIDTAVNIGEIIKDYKFNTASADLYTYDG